MPNRCVHIASTKSTDGPMHGNQAGTISSQSENLLNFPLLKGYCLKPKFCPKVEKKSCPGALATVNQLMITQQRMCNYFMKLM